ncbi:MAG: UDP-N-acetylmuramate dehydrogenase [Clostridiales bacterium]|nr:UDP-N-acetylmuramate dehydrogenase [Clostridiales bacterium]
MDSFSSLSQEIKNYLPDLELYENEPMKEHCSFKIGGPARLFALPDSEEQLQKLCLFLRERGQKPLIIGKGTNLLVTDEPLDGFVIKISDKLSEVRKLGETGLFAQCGISLARLASEAAQLSLKGLEFAHGIPGCLGGAVYMNAGAYGGEMKDVVKAAVCLDEELNFNKLYDEELDFSYRHSAFTGTEKIILGCEMELNFGDEGEIKAKMRELSERRRVSQPLDKPSGGSTFKRPKDGYAAALIDECGLKGFSIGGAQVSEKHAGFVINRGNASFYDVIRLMEHIRETVLSRRGVELSPELRIIDKI